MRGEHVGSGSVIAVTRPAAQLHTGLVLEKPLARVPSLAAVTVGAIRVHVAVAPHLMWHR